MKSHDYQFGWRDLLKPGLAPLLPVFLAPLLIHIFVDSLPTPRHLFDIDRTIITHQVEACKQSNDTDIVLIGDSSGLMGVDVGPLGDRIGLDVLNLGTISFLSLREYSEMLELYVENNRGRLKGVVIFVHPEALRRAAPEAYYVSFLHSVFNEEDHRHESKAYERLVGMLGLDMFRSRIWVRLVPPALTGEYGQMYGFTSDMDRYMTENGGCLIDPMKIKFKGNPEYRLAASWKRASERFHSLLPEGVKLGIGITPAPEEFVLGGHEEVYQKLLIEWGEWMKADIVLTNLPSTMPGKFFSTATHLSAEGREVYTQLVAEEFKSAFNGIVSQGTSTGVGKSEEGEMKVQARE